MGATRVQFGNSIDYTPGSAVDGGDVVVLAELVAVAEVDIAANTLGALAVTGIFDFNKTAGGGSAIAAGDVVFYDVAEGVAKEDAEAGANKRIGFCVASAADAATSVRCLLSQ